MNPTPSGEKITEPYMKSLLHDNLIEPNPPAVQFDKRKSLKARSKQSVIQTGIRFWRNRSTCTLYVQMVSLETTIIIISISEILIKEGIPCLQFFYEKEEKKSSSANELIKEQGFESHAQGETSVKADDLRRRIFEVPSFFSLDAL